MPIGPKKRRPVIPFLTNLQFKKITALTQDSALYKRWSTYQAAEKAEAPLMTHFIRFLRQPETYTPSWEQDAHKSASTHLPNLGDFYIALAKWALSHTHASIQRHQTTLDALFLLQRHIHKELRYSGSDDALTQDTLQTHLLSQHLFAYLRDLALESAQLPEERQLLGTPALQITQIGKLFLKDTDMDRLPTIDTKYGSTCSIKKALGFDNNTIPNVFSLSGLFAFPTQDQSEHKAIISSLFRKRLLLHKLVYQAFQGNDLAKMALQTELASFQKSFCSESMDEHNHTLYYVIPGNAQKYAVIKQRKFTPKLIGNALLFQLMLWCAKLGLETGLDIGLHSFSSKGALIGLTRVGGRPSVKDIPPLIPVSPDAADEPGRLPATRRTSRAPSVAAAAAAPSSADKSDSDDDVETSSARAQRRIARRRTGQGTRRRAVPISPDAAAAAAAAPAAPTFPQILRKPALDKTQVTAIIKKIWAALQEMWPHHDDQAKIHRLLALYDNDSASVFVSSQLKSISNRDAHLFSRTTLAKIIKLLICDLPKALNLQGTSTKELLKEMRQTPGSTKKAIQTLWKEIISLSQKEKFTVDEHSLEALFSLRDNPNAESFICDVLREKQQRTPGLCHGAVFTNLVTAIIRLPNTLGVPAPTIAAPKKRLSLPLKGQRSSPPADTKSLPEKPGSSAGYRPPVGTPRKRPASPPDAEPASKRARIDDSLEQHAPATPAAVVPPWRQPSAAESPAHLESGPYAAYGAGAPRPDRPPSPTASVRSATPYPRPAPAWGATARPPYQQSGTPYQWGAPVAEPSPPSVMYGWPPQAAPTRPPHPPVTAYGWPPVAYPAPGSWVVPVTPEASTAPTIRHSQRDDRDAYSHHSGETRSPRTPAPESYLANSHRFFQPKQHDAHRPSDPRDNTYDPHNPRFDH